MRWPRCLYKSDSLSPVPNPGTSLNAEGENQVHTFFCLWPLCACSGPHIHSHSRKAMKDSGHKDSNGFYTLYVKCLLSWHGVSRCCHTSLEFGTNCPHTWVCQVLSTIGVCPPKLAIPGRKGQLSLLPSPARFRAFILSASALFRVFLNLVLQYLNYEPLSDISHLS